MTVHKTTLLFTWMMHRFIEQDDTFNYWYDIYAYPIPQGMGDFFLKYLGGSQGGGFKNSEYPFYLSRGMASLDKEGYIYIGY